MSPSLIISQRPPSLSRQTSELEYDAAQQLLQHAQEGRLNPVEDAPKSHQSIASESYRQWQKIDGNGQASMEFEVRRVDNRTTPMALRELIAETNYGPLHNPPAMGQICR